MKKLKVLFITLFVIIIDQLSKLAIKGFSIPILNLHVDGLNYAEKHNIIGDFLRITFVENPGMAFGIDFGITSKLFLSLFSIVASIGIVYYLYKVREDGIMLKISLALILGGAIGNLIDRVFYGVLYQYAPLFYGKVVDFIDVDFFNINLFGYSYDRWPIFNFADMSVSIGVILLIFFGKRTYPKEEPEVSQMQDEVQGNVKNNSLEDNNNRHNGNTTDKTQIRETNSVKSKDDQTGNSKEIQI